MPRPCNKKLAVVSNISMLVTNSRKNGKKSSFV